VLKPGWLVVEGSFAGSLKQALQELKARLATAEQMPTVAEVRSPAILEGIRSP
jgi:hypothetical protein